MKQKSPRIFESFRRGSLGGIASSLLFVVLITGCSSLHSAPGGAQPGGGGRPLNCGGTACPAVTAQVSGNRCTVSVAVDPVKVSAGTVVYWTLAQPAADPIMFLPNGIVITDPNHDFIDPKISDDGTTFTWTANPRSSSRLPLKYSVHAVWMRTGTDGILCKVLDPIIVNEG
jgi:hypothetical protein